MQVELGEGVIETIQVCEGDVPSELAAAVVNKHSLPTETHNALTQAILSQLEALQEGTIEGHSENHRDQETDETPAAKRPKAEK